MPPETVIYRKGQGPGPDARWRTDLAAFWHGFSRPSALALGTFCLSLLATLMLCLWFFHETTLGGPYGRFLPRSALDDDGFATREALKAGQQNATDPRLLVVGTSTLAQAVGSGRELEQKLLDLTGQPWRVIVLTTAGQSPTEQFALLETALQNQRSDSPPVVIAVGVGPQRMRWTAEKSVEIAASRRIGLRSAWEDAEVQLLGGTPQPQTGFYPWDNRDFLFINGSRALLRLVLHQPAMRRVDYFARGHQGPESDEVRQTRGNRIKDAFPDRSGYYEQISRLAANLTSIPNTRLVLMEETISPDMIRDQDLGAIYDQMRQEFTELAQASGFAFWPVPLDAGLTTADYHDDIHLRIGDGQDKVRRTIAGHLAQLTRSKEATNGE